LDQLLTREDTKKKEKVPLEKKKIALFIRKKRADVALRSRALLVRRGSVRAELEDLADDDDDDDDDDAKKKSLKLSWVYIKPSARNNFFFCRVGHADARFSISISILGFFF
jgi:hypothetical protein